MRRLLTLILIAAMLPAFAQNATNRCLTSEISLRKAAADPQYAAELQQMHDAMVQYAQTAHATPRSTRTVSVAVHVVYNTAGENISTAYINNMIATMNQDYGYTNSDTNQVRSAFKSVRGNAQIQFCLDTIIRVHTATTCFDPNTNGDDMKHASTGGSNTFDPSHYLNIWICSLCGSSIQTGGIAGYTYLPTTGVAGSANDGVVLDYGLSFINQGHDRVATHETGHYFNLEHPWGNGSISTACGDDGFTDTPTTDGEPGGCTVNTNCTASPGSQYENFMDYSDCPHMFTLQQATEMNRVLTQVRTSLLSSPGCSNVPSAPIADFTSDKTTACPGSTVHFTDASAGSPTSWSWTFAGGTPSSSTTQNPSVVYNTAGTYTVTLVASNGSGSNTVTKTAYITVLASSALPLTEGFQGTTFPPTGWSLQNPDAGITFARVTTAGGYGTSSASAKIDCFNNTNTGDQDLLMSPTYNFTSVTSAKLKFDYAYAPYGASNADTMYVVFSNNCGDSIYLLELKAGTTLNTAPTQTTTFTPTAAQWKSDTIDLSFLAGQASVQVGFLVVNGYGNNIYLDNINMYSPPPAAPVVDFSGNPTTVVVGGTVNFTDLSTNSPTTWSWSFPGAVTTTSTVKNPTSIQYNTVGTYNVSLTAGNTSGSNAKTKTAYINVVSSLPAGCDTLSNILATDTLTIYLADTGATAGYLSGHNKYGDLGKADVFTAPANGMLLKGSYFYFGVAKYSSAASKVTVKAWDNTGTGGAPGAVLVSKDLFIDSIVTTGLTYVSFPTPPTINGTFYVGITYTYASGDTVALVTNRVNATHTTNTGWELASNNTWDAYNVGWGATTILSNVILPVLCSPTVVTPAPVAAFTGTPTTVCQGGTVTYTDQSTNTPTSWAWTFPGGTPATSTAQNPTVTYNTAGTYTATLIATNASGSNTSTHTNYITVKSPPTVTATVVNVNCPGNTNGSITTTTTGGTSPYTYRWTTTATTPNLTAVVAGTYSVTVTDNAGCTATISKTITEPLLITMSVVGTNATCGQTNGAATANAQGGTPPFTYSWSNGQSGTTVTGLAANTYNVTATDANGCTKVGSVVITSAGALSLNLVPTATTCGRTNGAVAATVTGGSTPYTYAWSNGQSTATASNLASGSYSVTVHDNGGCSATSSSTVGSSTSVSISATGTQANCTQSNGSATATPTGGSGYTYSWSNGQTTQTATGLAAGNYTVTVTAAGGCTASATASVSNVGGPTVSVSNSTNVLCFGGNNGTINLSVSGGNGTYTYNWSNSRTTQNLTGLTAGTYNVTVTSNGCVSTASGTITQPAQLVANATAQPVSCFGGSNGSVAVQVSGGTPNYSYLWSNSSSGANASNLSAGSVSITVTDQNSCSATTSTSVTQPTALSISMNGTNTGCSSNNGVASATVFGGTPGYTYFWNTNATTSSITGLAAGSYSVTATDAHSCTISQSVTLSTQSGPTITTSSTPVSCGGTNDGTASVNVTTGTSPYSYHWSNNQSTATISGLASASYSVTVTDGGGCTTTGTINVQSTGFSVTDNTVNVTGCHGGNTGSIALTVTGGSGNYTYHWSNSSTSSSLFTLLAGTYTVTINDATSGCQGTETYTVTEPSAVSGSVTTTPTVQGASTGTATVTATGGTGSYTYHWSNGQSVASLTGLAAGNYTVTITDGNNCTTTASDSVSNTVGIGNVNRDFKFEVYPNPNDGRFQVNLAFGQQTSCTIQIYNSLGALVYSVEKTNMLEDNFTIDLSAYSSATYFVRLVSNDHNMVKKVTIFK